MIAVKLRLKCQHCPGGSLEKDQDGDWVCINCGRQHDSKGKLKSHRVGDVPSNRGRPGYGWRKKRYQK